MNHIADLGRRIELVPMDPHCHDITLSLYATGDGSGGPAFRVHTYSRRSGSAERVAFVTAAMKVLGDMEDVPGGSQLVRFRCGAEHRLACRRLFLEACKLASDTALAARPPSVVDKKTGRTIHAIGLGDGAYRLEMGDGEPGEPGRIAGVANGLNKLAEMKPSAAGEDRVAFGCARPHDAIVGLLLPRALNVRAVLREEEAIAGRGILAAPSAQKT
jgi:hypothetical protein